MTGVVLPAAGWRDDADLIRLCDVLGAGQARFVGGAVRDGLLGLPVKDVDMATLLAPEAVMARLGSASIRVVPTGIAHGTVTAVLPRGPVEITTLRRDVATDGRHATVAFGTDWRADAARRDFTINALYADPGDGSVYDWFDGLADLDARRVRFIGDAAARIDEDHLRILRYFRFLARFGAADRASADYAACVDKAPTMMALSRERIADELMKLLCVADPVPALRLMVDGAIFRPIVPEADGAGVDRVAALVVREPGAGEMPDGVRRFAALMPDASTADRVAARLKLSNRARTRLAAALGDAVPGDARALAYRIGLQGARDRILLGRSDADPAALVGWDVPRLPVGGGDLIALGLAPGPAVSRALRDLEAAWIAAGYPARAGTLALADQLLGR